MHAGNHNAIQNLLIKFKNQNFVKGFPNNSKKIMRIFLVIN